MTKLAKVVACALVGSCMDCANSVLYDTTQKKSSSNYRKYKTSLHVARVLKNFFQSSSLTLLHSSTGSALNTA